MRAWGILSAETSAESGMVVGALREIDRRIIILSKSGWTVSLKLRRIDWNLAGVGLACSAVRAPGQGADQVAGDAPAQGGDRPGAMAGRGGRGAGGAGFRGVGVGGAEGGKGFARERGSRRPPGTG